MYTDPSGKSIPTQKTGWEAAPGSHITFDVPDDWKSGRIWGRTGCDFSKKDGATACATGSCNGGLECDKKSGTGVTPVSVAEWTLGVNGSPDNYDGKHRVSQLNLNIVLIPWIGFFFSVARRRV